MQHEAEEGVGHWVGWLLGIGYWEFGISYWNLELGEASDLTTFHSV
jgi:hypothetical protein